MQEVEKDYRDPVEIFDERHQETLANLDSQEPFPNPQPELNVITVIPIYAELSNNNFFRYLRGASLQTVPSDLHETVLVCSNLVQDTVLTDENAERYANYLENQETIRIVHFINQHIQDTDKTELKEQIETSFPSLTKFEKEMILLAIQRRVRLIIIDLSSPENADDQPFDFGKTVNIGAHLAFLRFQQLNKDGLIDFLDGDCMMAHSYVKELSALANQSDFQAIIKWPTIITPEQPLPTKKDGEHLLDLLFFYGKVLTFTRIHYTLDDMPEYFPESGEAWFSNHKLTARSSTFREIGGYPERASIANADFKFSGLLTAHADKKVFYIDRPIYYLSDRGRESSVDGQDILIGAPSTLDELRTQMHAEGHELIKKLCRLDEVIARLCQDHDQTQVHEEYLRFRRKAFARERIQHNAFLSHIDKLVSAVNDAMSYQPDYSVPEIIDTIEVPERWRDFFSTNPVLIQEIIAVISRNRDQEGDLINNVMAELQLLLPEYFTQITSHQEPTYIPRRLGENANIREYIHLVDAINYFMTHIVNLRNHSTDDGTFADFCEECAEMLQYFYLD